MARKSSRRCQYKFQESTPLGELMHNCLATAFAHTKLLLLCPFRADWCYRQSLIRYPTRYRSNPSFAGDYDHRDLGATMLNAYLMAVNQKAESGCGKRKSPARDRCLYRKSTRLVIMSSWQRAGSNR